MHDNSIDGPFSSFALCTTIFESFRSLRKLSERPKLMKTRIYSRQVAKFRNIFFLPLRLCVFAGDIPILLVAALPRCERTSLLLG
jgi:hypothetical protein